MYRLFIFLFIFLCIENFPSVCGKNPPGRLVCGKNPPSGLVCGENPPGGLVTRPLGGFFPQIDGKFYGHKNMNWKINTNRPYILNPANRRKKTSIDLKI